MGIRMLNKFLQDKCKTSISFINLSELSGKRIAVDISIYLYKFLSENALLENLYLMISIFREHKITPIFVFDGKPPVEKNDTIAFRKKTKRNQLLKKKVFFSECGPFILHPPFRKLGLGFCKPFFLGP